MLQLFWLEERCKKSVESQFHCWFNTKHAFFLAFLILAMTENMLLAASDDDMQVLKSTEKLQLQRHSFL